MHDIRQILSSLNSRQQSHSRPCYLVLIPRDTNDAHIRRRRIILDCKGTHFVQRPCDLRIEFVHSLVRDVETAPQPVSPKLVMMLCFRADQISLLFSWLSSDAGFAVSSALAVLEEHGMSSTRSHRFCNAREQHTGFFKGFNRP